ncbi:MAG TPA: tripartite tricarboxylate transporter substrate binding protein [Burkholderiaceae bacterium]|nr:tripartite tricarboxylate transporter substrate binding protein [Burkholderiaceae bacterium]
MRKFAAVAVMITSLAAMPWSTANAAWPERPVTITVGFGAGGTTDVVARAVGELLSKELGQPVVVENRAGAGGAVATTALSKMPADGYNMVVTMSTTVALDPKLSKLTYDVGDFTYVAAAGEFPEAYISLPSRGWKNLKDAAAEGKGKELTIASNSALDKLVTAFIAKQEGIKLALVPTRSGAEVVTQVMGGHVDLGYSSGAYYPQAASGNLNVLAVLGEKRLESLPDVPTLKELGYDIASTNLIMFIAPKGLPADVEQKLTGAMEKVIRSETIADLLKRRSVNPTLAFGRELESMVKNHSEGYGRLVDATRGQ